MKNRKEIKKRSVALKKIVKPTDFRVPDTDVYAGLFKSNGMNLANTVFNIIAFARRQNRWTSFTVEDLRRFCAPYSVRFRIEDLVWLSTGCEDCILTTTKRNGLIRYSVNEWFFRKFAICIK